MYSGSQPATRFEDVFLTAQQLRSVSQVKMEPRHGIMKAFPKVKRAKVLNGKDAPPVKKKPDECDVTGCYFTCERKWLLIETFLIHDVHYSCQIFESRTG